MIKRNIILLIPIILLFITGICYSQSKDIGNKSPEIRAREMTDRLNQKLTFTNNQDSLVFSVYQDFFSSLEMLKNFKANDDETQKTMQSAKNDRDSKIKTILTSDQYDKYSSITKDMQNSRDNGNTQRRRRRGN